MSIFMSVMVIAYAVVGCFTHIAMQKEYSLYPIVSTSKIPENGILMIRALSQIGLIFS